MLFRFKYLLLALVSLHLGLTTPLFSQELKIERKQHLVSYLQDGDEILKRWIKSGNGLYEARFIVPSTFLNLQELPPIDPFANETPKEQADAINKNAKKVLIQAGLVFGEGSSVSYDLPHSMLTVVQTPDQLELCEAYLSGGCHLTYQQISVRAEIYELPSRLALQLLESCEDQGDHTPERNAVRQLMKQGDAKLIALPSILSRSGQRSKIIDAYEVPFLANALPQKDVKAKKTPQPLEITSRPVGTLFEVDPVLGADNWTIDLSFQLEHHTGPPEFIDVSDQLKTPVFHNKEITTQVTLLKESYLLIGTWKPTGKPEYENSDLMHVIFLTANVQNTRDYGVLAPQENEASKAPSKK
ncbi:MAG: type II and III secretion system protein [Verrucomicrobiales bacterium]|nr:type II and III secretion system protein [Verrucomicrobiales bacterium]